MNKLHKTATKHLKLQHHRHTGRVLHHKHTSYRGLAVVLVLAGMVMVGATMVQRAAADELFGVYGVVPEPVPASSAVISTPAGGSTVTSSDMLVAGSCPIVSPQVTVALLMDGAAAGSAICDSHNNFALPVILAPGAHTFVAQTYTSTWGRGSDSLPMQVTYQPPKPVAQVAPPVLTPTTPLAVMGPDRQAVWNGTVSGGMAPYHVLIDWGDSTRTTYTITTAAASQHFTHHYAILQPYNARVAVRDSAGNSAQQQYATTSYALLASAPVASVTTANSNPSTGVMAGLYGMFLTVLSVSCIIWIESKHAARQELAAARVV